MSFPVQGPGNRSIESLSSHKTSKSPEIAQKLRSKSELMELLDAAKAAHSELLQQRADCELVRTDIGIQLETQEVHVQIWEDAGAAHQKKPFIKTCSR